MQMAVLPHPSLRGRPDSFSIGTQRKIPRAANGSGTCNGTLFNDRYGMHRIYYHEAKEAFYFSAEAKAILAVRPELRVMDRRSLGEFVACGCV